MIRRFTSLVQSLRPLQWLKNGFVLAPLVFAGAVFDSQAWARSMLAVIAFCAAASATYLINDLVDRKADRAHPTKCRRPIASGAVLAPVALVTAVVLLCAAALIAALLRGWFPWVLGTYFVLTTLYSTFLKRAVFIDVMVVAAGFVLRVVGGAVAIPVDVSHWLLVCAYLLALYLALGKRRSELVLLGETAGEHRAVLGSYSLPLVDHAISVVLGSTLLAYTLYTVSPDTVEKVGSEGLLITAPIVLYGLLRYLFLLHRDELGGSPTKALLADRPLLACVVVWLIVAGAVIGAGV